MVSQTSHHDQSGIKVRAFAVDDDDGDDGDVTHIDEPVPATDNFASLVSLISRRSLLW